VFSRHNASHLSDCVVHCFDASDVCIGFKYRSSTNHFSNCELFKAMEISDGKPGNESEEGNWEFYKTVRDKPVS
jgi:hypothetical protein